MVERILDAAGNVLHENGLAEFGTRQTAEAAGISVGSLYQYFDSKEAILRALGGRMVSEFQSEIQKVIPRLNQAPSRDFIRILITSAYAVLDRDGGRNLTLMRHWKELNLSADVGSVERVLMQYVELLSNTQPLLRSMPDKQRTLYIGINAVFFNLMRYASEPSPYFSREELVEGLVEMLELYVQSRILSATAAGKPDADS